MKDHKHESSSELEEQLKFFENLEIPYNRDKKAVWDEMTKKIEAIPPRKIVPLIWTRIAVAAVLIMTFSVAFMRFYTTTITCERGRHLAYTLPDNSTVQLNAASTISFAPYWWSFQRQVSLEGEAFFEVEKGSSFIVASELGYTEVLGTSFNIYARDTAYVVFCKTGKVGVHTTKDDQSLILTPSELGLLQKDVLKKQTAIDATISIGWLNNKFLFDNVNLVRVLEELERQYDAKINYEGVVSPDLMYGGFFDKTENIDTALEMIGANFGFSFIKVQENLYNVEINS
ncbi:FecR family protein [Aureispira anguillae]|uniref:FecR domain-containing protein n=1 Tax=Aureispira anguillae TaxID=2864201 RepID=A0A915YG69_9BACT|nr:FecR domain-containing protein [Aureispira anguillae]BDS12553.1 FecR domain-containing protein [Aureispira anguillae]